MRGIPEDKIRAWIEDVNGRCLNDTWWIEGELLEYIEELQEPWMTLDEFLKSGFIGFCWIRQADYIENSYFDGETFFESSTGSHCYHKYNTELVMPIRKPEPPR